MHHKGITLSLLISSLMQAIFLVISIGAGNSGEMSRLVLGSIVLFWVAALPLVWCRGKKTAHSCLYFARYGFIGILFLIAALSDVLRLAMKIMKF